MPSRTRFHPRGPRSPLLVAIISSLAYGCGGGGDSTGPGKDVPVGNPAAPVVGSVRIVTTLFDISVGETRQLTAEVLSTAGVVLSGESVSWSSADNAIATVSSSGLVSALREGTVVITARSTRDTSKSATATARVSDVVVVVQLIPGQATLAVGEELQMQVSAFGVTGSPISLDGRTVQWNSSSPIVASVSATGLVLGRSVGQTEIRVQVDGVSPSGPSAVAVQPFSAVCFAGAITFNERVRDTLVEQNQCLRDGGETFEIWSFQGQAGEQIQIELTSGRNRDEPWLLDPFALLAPAGVNFNQNATLILESDDDDGPGLNARLIETLPETGEYWIAVSGFLGRTGDYILTLLRDGEWVEIDLQNDLRSTLDVSVNGEIIGWAWGRSQELFYIPPVSAVNLFARVSNYGPNLHLGQNLGVRWDEVATVSGSSEAFRLSNRLTDGTVFFVALVTNNGADVDFGFNWGRDEEVRCCLSQVGDVDLLMNYHLLFGNTQIRAYNHATDYTGGFLAWLNNVQFTEADIVEPAGDLFLSVTQAPVATPVSSPQGQSDRNLLPTGRHQGASILVLPPSGPAATARDQRPKRLEKRKN